MRRLVRFLAPFKKQMILGPLFKLTEAVLELLIPLMMMRVIDDGVMKGDTAYIWRMGGSMLAVSVVGFGCALLCQYYASLAAQGVGTNLRNEAFGHINRLSFAELDRFGTPTLINRVTADINQLQWAVAMLIRLVLRAPFLCVGGFLMALWIDAELSLLILAVILVFGLILYLSTARAVPLFRRVQQKLDALSRVLRENLSGVRVIRAFARVKGENERFSKASDAHADASVAVSRVAALVNPLTSLIMNAGILLLLYFGAVRVNSNTLTTGEVIALINYVIDILAAMLVVANLVSVFTKAAASAARVNELFDTQPSVADGPGASPSPDAPLLRFEAVSFRYGDAAADALENISFTLNKGETLGIIGGTGAGKSTLANLICRFYDATEGRVLLCGEDIKNYALSSLRKYIGVVPQKSVLFSGTLRENLLYGNAEAADGALFEALRAAQAEFVLKLPEGLDTKVLQGGVNFSGGQKQRLCIARALVQKPALLILDDSSSALDYMTEAALRRELNRIGDMAVVQITQRAASILHAGRILVLEDGAVAGLGTHAELKKNCPLYREILKSQELAGEESA
ncbi:MAG TPA: ABC transporter ATP-binding protein [Feifaniaceae bacterium]|nr:ABC transporter ATP-binding protein [Feifaniaceae bacterium]